MKEEWALNKLMDIIRENEKTIKKLIFKICELKNISYSSKNINDIKKEIEKGE